MYTRQFRFQSFSFMLIQMSTPSFLPSHRSLTSQVGLCCNSKQLCSICIAFGNFESSFFTNVFTNSNRLSLCYCSFVMSFISAIFLYFLNIRQALTSQQKIKVQHQLTTRIIKHFASILIYTYLLCVRVVVLEVKVPLAVVFITVYFFATFFFAQNLNCSSTSC